MGRSKTAKSYFMGIFFVKYLTSIIEKKRRRRSSACSFPEKLKSLEISQRLRFDFESLNMASTDYGNLIKVIPAAVLYPTSELDLVTLIRSSYGSSSPFTIAARGQAHSNYGQAMAQDGIVVNMRALNILSEDKEKHHGNGFSGRISLCKSGSYVDVGGEQLWIEVMNATLKHGVAPKSWTDYLHLTVGGTLSNAGISGQTFRYGPQICNVYEMDVVTGRGEVVTCSRNLNSDLFYGVLGGFGQFGIITRARIPLAPAPTSVKWVRMIYDDFSSFTSDEEHLITLNAGDQPGKNNGLDYVEGFVILNQSSANNWKSSFFSADDRSKITSLLTQHNVLYYIEVAKYYDPLSANTVDKELEMLLEGLNFVPGIIFVKDLSYVDFMDRVRTSELELRSRGLWDIPHPWIDLFVPKSRIFDINEGVFKGILQQNLNLNVGGPILCYPMLKSKWDDKMSAVIPDEDIFYSVELLCGSKEHWFELENQNKKIMDFCEEAGIKVKSYLPNYTTSEEWINHFGPKWDLFKERKNKFDPLAILSPGQRIFNFKS